MGQYLVSSLVFSPNLDLGELRSGSQSWISLYYSLFAGFGHTDDFANDWQHRHPVVSYGRAVYDAHFPGQNCGFSSGVTRDSGSRDPPGLPTPQYSQRVL